MSYSGPTSVQSGWHQIGQLIIRILLALAGIIIVLFSLSLILPFMLLIIGYSHPIHLFDIALFFEPLHQLEYDIFGSASQSMYPGLCLVLCFGIPIALLFYSGVRFIFGIKYSETLGSTAFNIWIVNFAVLLFFAIHGWAKIHHHEGLNLKHQTPMHLLQKGLEMAAQPLGKTKAIFTTRQ